MTINRIFLSIGCALATSIASLEASEASWELLFETGGSWQSLNEARIPGKASGDELQGDDVDLLDFIDDEPALHARMELHYRWRPRHLFALTLAPFGVSGTGELDAETNFDQVTFDPGVPTKASYKFNTYRLSYYYQPRGPDEEWRWAIGGTILVRDAYIQLEQAGKENAKSDDLGVVPLLHARLDWQPSENWSLRSSLDGAWSPQGRAFDLAIASQHQLNDRWDLGYGYRTIEGGADNDPVYTFAWIHTAFVRVNYRW